MARKRKRDAYTSTYIDRHGHERCRFRRNGHACPLPHPLSPTYRDAYADAMARSDGVLALQPRSKPKSIGDLVPRFYASLKFRKGGADWQRSRKLVLEAFREEFADDLVANFRPKDIEKIVSDKMEKRVVDKKAIGGTHAAKRLREQLHALFGFAVKLEWISSNPVEKTDDVEHKPIGFYPWTEEDIAAFRDHWKLGTKPRLAMELVLWTGARRGDAHKAAPPKNGRITFTAAKTGKEQNVPVAPMLQQAIEGMPSVGITTLLVTDYGKPFTRAGFGNWFKDKCVRAGLPQCTLHGLRKALARRAADQGVQQQGLKALGQWSGDREVAIYVAGANQRRLAESALAEVIAWEEANNCRPD
jgi:integrase